MGRGRDEQDVRHETATTKGTARFARAEVVDVLAEGLWSLILADRWPGARDRDERVPDPPFNDQQPIENAGV